MPRQRARATAQDGSTSLLSSVFSFVSREIDSFVSNATGKPPREDEDEDEDEDDDEDYEDEDEEEPQASSSRMRLPERKTRKHEEKLNSVNSRCQDTEHKYGEDGVNSRASHARSQSRRRDRGTSDSEDESRRRAKRVASSPLTPPRPVRRQPVPPDEEEEQLVGSDRLVTPSPKRHHGSLHHKRSYFTMPGALYDRTSSLEPTPEPDGERTRHVRFASEVSGSPSPSRKQLETPRSSRNNNYVEAGSSSGRKGSSSFGQHARKMSVAEVEMSSEDEGEMSSSPIKRSLRPRSNSFVQAAIRQRSVEKNPDVSLLLPRSPIATIYSSPSKGKGKEKAPDSSEVAYIEDSDEESGSDGDRDRSNQADLSVRTRMKGKEQELHSARQREREREDDEERRRDKERIRILEEELRKLREELARRPAVPPPPPPPPPPRPPVSSVPQSNQPASTFANVRASLRHAGTPVEKPINPAAYGGPSTRKGQPTINVGADMMAAFLTELKTHRLRKVSGSGEGSSAPSALRSQPAVRVREVGDVGNRSEIMSRPRQVEDIGNRSEVLPRPNRSFTTSAAKQQRTANLVNGRHAAGVLQAEARVGDKRKHTETSNDVSRDSLPSKRRALATLSRAGDSSADSLTSLSTSSSRESRLPIRPSHPIQAKPTSGSSQSHPVRTASDASLNSRLSSGMRAETEVTTPSLSSDNEQENGSNESQEGRSPPTPPPESSASMSMLDKGTNPRSTNAEQALRSHVHVVEDAEDVDVEMNHHEQPPSRPRQMSRNQESPQMAEIFSTRAHASPRLLDSPRRPRAPARSRVIKNATEPEECKDEDEDPLSLSYVSANAPSYVYSHVEERQEEQGRITNAPESPPLRLPLRPPPGMFKPPKSKNNLPSRLPIRQGSQKNKQSKPSARARVNTSSATSSTHRRRDSLGAELLRAEEMYEATFEADVTNDEVQLESGTFTGTGTRSRKQGFIAFGGAGGPSAVIGGGSVEGLENLVDSEEEETVSASRSVRRSAGSRRL